MYRGTKQITMKASEFPTGRLYSQRELWDMLLLVIVGLNFLSLLIIYFF